MGGYLLPRIPFFPPPPPPSVWSPTTPPQASLEQFTPKPTTDDDNATSPGVFVGVAMCVGAFFILLILLMRYHNIRANAVAAHAAAAAAALTAPPRAPPLPEYWDNEEVHRHYSGHDDDDDDDVGHTQRASPTADLPSFTYGDREVTHNVTGSGDEAATCSVCLGAFQAGETVRLLPVCLHLYHVECIDQWLEAHSTCPLCRSGTGDDPTMHDGLLPPV